MSVTLAAPVSISQPWEKMPDPMRENPVLNKMFGGRPTTLDLRWTIQHIGTDDIISFGITFLLLCVCVCVANTCQEFVDMSSTNKMHVEEHNFLAAGL